MKPLDILNHLALITNLCEIMAEVQLLIYAMISITPNLCFCTLGQKKINH